MEKKMTETNPPRFVSNGNFAQPIWDSNNPGLPDFDELKKQQALRHAVWEEKLAESHKLNWRFWLRAVGVVAIFWLIAFVVFA